MAVPVHHSPILVPPLNSFDDVRQALSQKLGDLQRQLIAALPVTDMQGNRLQNVGSPQQAGDAVNLQYLQSVVVAPITSAATTTTATATIGGIITVSVEGVTVIY